MKPTLSKFTDIAFDVENIIINRNSFILNSIMLIIFLSFFSVFIYISYKDTKEFNKDYTLRKLLFIRRNT